MYLVEASNYFQNEIAVKMDSNEPTVSCAWCAKVQDSDGEWNEAPKPGRFRLKLDMIQSICSACHVKVWAPLIAIV